VGPFLERRAIERQAYTAREQFVSRGDKAVRAQSIRGRMAMLGFYVRQGAHGLPTYGPRCSASAANQSCLTRQERNDRSSL